jgi:tetratricopeptide (TPR) repeat protein
MTPEERLYQEAMIALKKKDMPQARDLLSRLLKLNRLNPDYWLWMSAAVETTKERGYCLKEVLKLDPQNLTAIRGLRLMGEPYDDPEPPLSIEQLRTNWKTSLELKQTKVVRPKGLKRKIAGLTFLGILVVGGIIGGILLTERGHYEVDTSPILRISLTPSPTITTTPTITATLGGQAALITVLEITFTPTPIYVSTPHNRSEAYGAALKAYGQQDWVKAGGYFNQVILVEPNSPDLHYLLGETYRFQHLYKEAAAAYEAAILIDPAFGPAYLGKGRVLMQSSPPKVDEALLNFEKAIEKDPNLSEALLEIVNVNLVKGNGSSALTWLEKYENKSPSTAITENYRAQAYLLLSDPSAALKSVEKARVMDVSYMPVYRLWGEILQANGRFKESILPLLAYLKSYPLDLGSELFLARAYVAEGDDEKALASLNTAITSDSKFAEALALRGEIYLRQDKKTLAADDFNNALRAKPALFDALIGKGQLLLKDTYAGAAFNTFELAAKAATTPRQKAVAQYWRASALVGLEKFSTAIREYELFLSLPESVAPAELRTQALAEYLQMVTPTPTATNTKTSTPTPTPSVTVTHTITPTPSPTTRK